MTNRFFSAIIVPVRNAAMAQLVERVLGKDEVSSSNLDSSSKKPRRNTVGALVLYRGFLWLLSTSNWRKFRYEWHTIRMPPFLRAHRALNSSNPIATPKNPDGITSGLWFFMELYPVLKLEKIPVRMVYHSYASIFESPPGSQQFKSHSSFKKSQRNTVGALVFYGAAIQFKARIT